VPTPIGNLDDITLRAIEILGRCDYIAAEDTRKARILLDHLQIKARLISFHVKNERYMADKLIDRIERGQTISLISENGMPSISDPGYTLIYKAIERDIPMDVLPGPSAFLAALVLSGFPVSGFAFEGFLSHSGKGRRRRLRKLADEIPRTLVFYVSPHRLQVFLEDVLNILGNRKAALCREISKIHQEVVRASVSELIDKYSDEEIRGELVLVLSPDTVDNST